MSPEVVARLFVIALTIGAGALALRLNVFGSEAVARERHVRALGDLASLVLIPALLFRTMARLDLGQMPWVTVQAYFAPALLFALGVRAWFARQRQRGLQAGRPAAHPAEAATRAVAATYSNAVQLGIPLSSALFGERGLAIHIALVSVHGLVLLTVLTVAAETDVARGERAGQGVLDVVKAALRSTLTHPVVLPIVLGLLYNLSGLGLPAVFDQTLLGIGAAGVPLCLLLIGMNLVQFGLGRYWRAAIGTAMLKLLALPALVLLSGGMVFGLKGLALEVPVMMAALPVGVNALIFGQRYRVLEGDATAAIVVSTLGFAATAPLWLWALQRLA